MERGNFFLTRAERIALSIFALLGVIAVSLLAASGSTGETSQEIPRTVVPQDSFRRTKDYVGPPSGLIRKGSKKFPRLTVLDLNQVDSLTLIRVPGIGPAFAHRILSLRRLLGGYYTTLQLQEVYGMDEDKFLSLRGWFKIGSPPKRYLLDSLHADELPEHRYLSWVQRKALAKLIYRHGSITSWAQIMRDSSFTRDDSVRLSHYFIEHRGKDQKP